MSFYKAELKYYYLALVIGLVIHGSLVFFTFDDTYDAFVHIFFADHYAKDWFETWDYRWYTGFTVTSYPPLVHHAIALLSKVVGLKLGFICWSWFVVVLIVRGAYKFSLLWVEERAAMFAAMFAVFSTSVAEALHIFGQLPSLTGSALLLNACPEIYRWLRYDDRRRLILALLFLAVISSAHHVTTIFGMVFFVMPVLGLAVFDRAQEGMPKGETVQLSSFLREAIRVLPRLIAFGMTVIFITLIVIFPYWYWSKSDPITQVPIPHGSRDSFIEVSSSGLVFFLIPWGMMLFFLPFFFLRLFRKRYIFLCLSAALLFLLGTGGTTPLPKMLLGETAFEILTLDRFTYWGTLVALPFWGLFLYELFQGSFRDFLVQRIGPLVHRLFLAFFVAGTLVTFVLVVNISFFRTLQPDPIDIEPITKFLEKDFHYRWRFMTLGFGDQMAWLSANTSSLSVDGNYHSVRRLPEMTTRAVERLENAKYQGEEGISSLRQFLTVPERYHLKFIFSNDQFYDPLLHYSGWRKLQRLENDIVVWEKADVPPLPAILPKKEIPVIQRIMWGLLPLSAFSVLLLFFFLMRTPFLKSPERSIQIPSMHTKTVRPWIWGIQILWVILLAAFVSGLHFYNKYETSAYHSPENTLQAYYHELDYKRFNGAYQFLDPDLRPPLDQFLLQQSLKGGILSSFAKLDTLVTHIRPVSPDSVFASVTAHWITSLMEYTTTHQYQLHKKKGMWYILPSPADPTEPSDTFIRQPGIDFHGQGRRKALVNYTARRDVLDRPEVYIRQASLVERDSQYFVIGEILNTDNDPAHLTVQVVLYDQYDEEYLRFNTRDLLNYRLLPKESTPFRIDLQEEWISQSGVRNLDDRHPTSFVLFVRSVVSDEDSYKQAGIFLRAMEGQDALAADLYNYGTEEIIIPKILISQFEGTQMKWVERIYLPYGIKPQRKLAWVLDPLDIRGVKTIYTGKDTDLVVNGLSRRWPPGFKEEDKLPAPSVQLPGQSNRESRIQLNLESFTAVSYED